MSLCHIILDLQAARALRMHVFSSKMPTKFANRYQIECSTKCLSHICKIVDFGFARIKISFQKSINAYKSQNVKSQEQNVSCEAAYDQHACQVSRNIFIFDSAMYRNRKHVNIDDVILLKDSFCHF